MYLDESVSQTEVFEGRVPWIYLDPKGNPTTACGFLIATLNSALVLPFQIIDAMTKMQRPATQAEISADYSRVKNSTFGPQFAAGYYKWAMSVFLENAVIDEMLRGVLLQCDDDLRNLFPKYPTFPDPAKLALLDMRYNLGLRGLEEYVELARCLDAITPDFMGAAAECGRNQGDRGFQKRNDWTRAQFRAAAAAVRTQQTYAPATMA